VNLPDWFMGLVRCPITGTRLMLASAAQLQSLQRRQATGKLTTRLGRTVSGPLTQGLVSEDGRWFYPVEEGALHLLPDDAIAMG